MENKKKELQEYLKEKNISQILKTMVESILLEKPDNVPSFMVDYLVSTYNLKDKRKPALKKKNQHPHHNEIKNFKIAKYLPKKSNYQNNDNSFPSPNNSNIHIIDSEKADANRRRYSVSVYRRGAVSSEPLSLLKPYKIKKVKKTEEQLKQLRASCTNIPLFQKLEKEEIEEIYHSMTEKKFKKGENIINQGEEGDYFYVIKSGECEIFKIFGGSNKKKLLKTTRTGDYFGELALMFGTPRAATVTAKTDVTVWRIFRTDYRKILMDSTQKTRETYENFFKKVEILKTLDSYERNVIADCVKKKIIKTGEVIIKEGEKGDKFFIIKEGKVEASKEIEGVVGELSVGEYFGELALLFNHPRAATITAKTDVQLLQLSRRDFKTHLGPCEDILRRNMESYKFYMRVKKQTNIEQE